MSKSECILYCLLLFESLVKCKMYPKSNPVSASEGTQTELRGARGHPVSLERLWQPTLQLDETCRWHKPPPIVTVIHSLSHQGKIKHIRFSTWKQGRPAG